MNMALFGVDFSAVTYPVPVTVLLITIFIVFHKMSRRMYEQCRMIEAFNPSSEYYGQTTATVKSKNIITRMSLISYNVDGKEFSVKVHHYLKSDSTDIIYPKDKPQKAIMYDYELVHRTMKKFRILSLTALTIILIPVLLIICFCIYVSINGLGDFEVSSYSAYLKIMRY